MTDENVSQPRRLNRPYWVEPDDERPPIRRGEEEEGRAGRMGNGRPPRRPKRNYRWHAESAGAPLNTRQIEQFQTVAQTYTPDLDDAAAAEVLLVLLEIGYILELSETQLNHIFGPRCRRALSTWGDVLPAPERPAEVQRAWVWLSNRRTPALYPIGEDGAIRVYG